MDLFQKNKNTKASSACKPSVSADLISTKYLTKEEMDGKIAAGIKHKIIQLTNISNETVQDILYFCKIGEEVDISEDEDGHIYVDGLESGEIGRCPKSVSKFIQDDFESYVYNISKNEKQQFVASVIIFQLPENDDIELDEENDEYEEHKEYIPEKLTTVPCLPWYQKTHYIILLLFFLFPLGAFYMWKYLKWGKPVKIIISIAGGLTWLCAFLTSSPSSTAAALTTLLSLVIF